MTFLASTEASRKLLAAKIGKEEHIKDIVPDEVDSETEIPLIGHRHTVPNSKFCKFITKITSKALIEILTEETPTSEEIDAVFSEFTNSDRRFVPYNRQKLESLAARFPSRFQPIFSHETLRYFVACRKYFDVVGFRAFIDSILRLRDDLKLMLKYCSQNGGIMSTDGLSKFIEKKIPTFDSLVRLQGEHTYIPFYRQTVLEETAFRLDPLGLNRISVNDLITSPHFAKFLDLDENDRRQNPFSVHHFVEWFGPFSRSVDSRGLCTRASFKHFRNWHLCDAFVDRVFEESSLFDGCMDFGGFYRFVVHRENCTTEAGARYFFNLFDTDDDGHVGPFDLSYFYRDLVRESSCDAVAFSTFTEEILDMVQAPSIGFTLEQFIASGACQEIIAVLSDYKEFKLFVDSEDA